MYEELIQRLRRCNQFKCNGCDYENVISCRVKLNAEAADAIEGLSGLVNHYGGETGIKNLEEYASRYWDLLKNAPRWISVEERLPDNKRDVQITVFWHDAYRTMYGYYDGEYWHLYAPMHTRVADVEVIGWMEKPSPMPLPEPTKEGR